MKEKSGRMIQNRLYLTAAVIIGIALNVLLSYITHYMKLPIYLDTVGTIAVSILGGAFPGILVGVISNTICTLFYSFSPYFGSINAIIAIVAVCFFEKRSIINLKIWLFFILTAGLISGGLSALIDFFVLEGPINPSVVSMLSAFRAETGYRRLLVYVVICIALSIFDKGLTAGVAGLIVRFLPKKISDGIKNSRFMQRPITSEEMESFDSLSGRMRSSFKKRLTFTYIGMGLLLVIITVAIAFRLYLDNTINEKKDNAAHAAAFAAKVVDGDMIDAYLRDGRFAPGYGDTEALLYDIRENAPGVRYLYILKISEKGSTFIFDLEEKEEYKDYDGETMAAYKPGDFVPIEESFLPYVDALLSGEEIPAIESWEYRGWMSTSYSPIYDSTGRCVAYAGADASLDYISGGARRFFASVLVIMLGFFIMIVAFGMWTSGSNLSYPISSIVRSVEEFIGAGSDRAALDESVRHMTDIDIHTGDELEKLYTAICDMAVNQTEQLRSLRRFAENTSRMQDGLIITMADLVENRDSDTGAHIHKTAAYVKIIANSLKKKGYYEDRLTPKYISDVVRSAPLHDIGKIDIPDAVLGKPGRLTDEEYEIMKTHTTAGKKIIERAIGRLDGENYLKEARNMAAYHHERWDGKGYPEGLQKEVIPLSARIMALADVFDALTSPRVYKPAFPLEQAIEMIKEGSGSQFDPRCVEAFLEALPEVKVILKKYNAMYGGSDGER